MTPRRLCAAAPVAMALALLAGCSPSKVTITGTILQDNQPMIVADNVYVTISFTPESADKGTAQSATFDRKTGKYTVTLPSGSYKSKVVIALPPKKEGAPPIPLPAVESADFYDLTKSKSIDLHVPAFPKGK